MILLCGIRSESPLAMVGEALTRLRAPFVIVHQRDVAHYSIDWSSDTEGIRGSLRLVDDGIELAEVTGVYLRLMDDNNLPEVAGLAPDHPARLHARGFHEALFRWSEVSPARVINRADPQGSNSSKPYQAQLIEAHGFRAPPTLITNEPNEVLAFRREHGQIIYKSISSVRSIVRIFEDADLERLDRIRWCPVQFQAAIGGLNIRVHVIGNEVFSTQIQSTHIDYRYAKRQGGETRLTAVDLPKRIAARCIEMTRALGLEFAGIDLMRTKARDYYCFEVNPQPAFSYFEANTGQKISEGVARHLARTMEQAGSGSRED